MKKAKQLTACSAVLLGILWLSLRDRSVSEGEETAVPEKKVQLYKASKSVEAKEGQINKAPKISSQVDALEVEQKKSYPDYVLKKDRDFYSEPLDKEWALRVEGVIGDFLADHFNDDNDLKVHNKLLETMPDGLAEKLEQEGINIEKFKVEVEKFECRSKTCRLEFDFGGGDHPVEKKLSNFLADTVIVFMTKGFFAEFQVSPIHFKHHPSIIYIENIQGSLLD